MTIDQLHIETTSGCFENPLFENPLSPILSSKSKSTTSPATTTATATSSPTVSTAKTPKYFAAHQYEYEISPEQPTKPSTCNSNSTCNSSTTTTTSSCCTTPDHKQHHHHHHHIITETSVPMTKTIYLIRHAESDENRRKECLKMSMKGLGKLKLPKREDVVASMELMNVGAQLDSDVSPRGQAQIDQLGRRIANDDFITKMGIDLVAHSPLQRARQTCYGMLQSVAPASSHNANSNNTNTNNNNQENNNANNDTPDNPIIKGCTHPSIKRVVELDILSERTPIEWLPIQHDAFTRRIAEFEMWLSEQPEDVIAIVGHSLYFKNMLGLESKFHNVDVWSLQFDFTVENSVQRVRQDVSVANESETKKKIQKHLDNLGSMIQIQKSNYENRRKKNRNTSSGGTSDSNTSSTNTNVNTNVNTDSNTNNSDNSNNNDSNHQNNMDANANNQDDTTQTDGSSCDLDNRDETNTSSSVLKHDSQTDIDGVCLGSLKLPRGWRELKHHYRFDPNYHYPEE